MPDVFVKAAAQLQDKFASRAQNATNDYVGGVKTTQKDQNALAQAAAPRWATGVQAAIANDQFKKGLAHSSTDQWRTMAAEKGGRNFGPGAAGAKAKWAARVQPFFDTLNSLVFTQSKLPKGDLGNMARSSQVAATLHAKKVAG